MLQDSEDEQGVLGGEDSQEQGTGQGGTEETVVMGWHCITVWECELKPAKREETLDSIAFTLNHIWLQDHGAKTIPYPKLDEEDIQMPLAAEARV